ncbi:Integral membrane protein [candidate division SR1 bacterium RAAC1_SR1_1]|nr:Integral membrane protein [candidate division SR1 bacterium RAAC1_SR1_1]
MKKVLAVIGIILPFIFGLLWIISSVLILEMTGEPTSTIISLSYLKVISMIGTIVGFITLIVGVVYLGREKGLTHKEIMSQSRKLTKKNVWKYMLGVVLVFFLQILQQEISEPNQPMTLAIAILTILLGIAYLRVDFGLKGLSLSLVEDKIIKSLDIFVSAEKFVKYFVAYIIIVVFSLIGIILFIVPGVFVALRLNMVPYLILSKNLGPWEAIKQSRKLTKGKVSNLFALNVLLGFINILGFVALIVGLFWTLPLFYIANAVFYKKLLSFKK